VVSSRGKSYQLTTIGGRTVIDCHNGVLDTPLAIPDRSPCCVWAIPEHQKRHEDANQSDRCVVRQPGRESDYRSDATEDRCSAEQFESETARDDATEPGVGQ
jgi:hypothetical protein